MKETNPKHWLPGVEGELKIKEATVDHYKFKVGNYIITITATEIHSVTINYDIKNKPVPGSFRTIGGGGDGTGKSNWNEIKFGSNHTTGEGGSGARDVPAGGGGHEVIGGTFKVGCGSMWTEDIPYNASDAGIDGAIEKLKIRRRPE
jgi:hypothetical protein